MTVPKNSKKSNLQFSNNGKNPAGSRIRMAAAIPRAPAIQTSETKGCALGVCKSQPFPSQKLNYFQGAYLVIYRRWLLQCRRSHHLRCSINSFSRGERQRTYQALGQDAITNYKAIRSAILNKMGISEKIFIVVYRRSFLLGGIAMHLCLALDRLCNLVAPE